MDKKFPLRLRKRAEFLAVRTGEKRRGRYFLLEVKKHVSADSLQISNDTSKKCAELINLPKPQQLLPRIGFTVTKRNGNAVKRNRIKRRLREALRVELMQNNMALMRDMGERTDYVIVARPDALTASFKDLKRALHHRITITPSHLKKSGSTKNEN